MMLLRVCIYRVLRLAKKTTTKKRKGTVKILELKVVCVMESILAYSSFTEISISLEEKLPIMALILLEPDKIPEIMGL